MFWSHSKSGGSKSATPSPCPTTVASFLRGMSIPAIAPFLCERARRSPERALRHPVWTTRSLSVGPGPFRRRADSVSVFEARFGSGVHGCPVVPPGGVRSGRAFTQRTYLSSARPPTIVGPAVVSASRPRCSSGGGGRDARRSASPRHPTACETTATSSRSWPALPAVQPLPVRGSAVSWPDRFPSEREPITCHARVPGLRPVRGNGRRPGPVETLVFTADDFMPRPSPAGAGCASSKVSGRSCGAGGSDVAFSTPERLVRQIRRGGGFAILWPLGQSRCRCSAGGTGRQPASAR